MFKSLKNNAKSLKNNAHWIFSGIGVLAISSLFILLQQIPPLWSGVFDNTVQFIEGSDNALVEVTEMVGNAESRVKVLSYGSDISQERETLFSKYTDTLADRLNTHESLQYQILITRKEESLSQNEIQFVEDRLQSFNSKMQRESKQILYRHQQPSSPGFFLFIVDNESLLMGFSTLEGEAAPTIPRYCIKFTAPKSLISEITNLYDNLWDKAESFTS